MKRQIINQALTGTKCIRISTRSHISKIFKISSLIRVNWKPERDPDYKKTVCLFADSLINKKSGEGGSRTLDKGLMSPLLWPLSYLAAQRVI